MQPVGGAIARSAMLAAVVGVQLYWVSPSIRAGVESGILALCAGLWGVGAFGLARTFKRGVRFELLMMTTFACCISGPIRWVWTGSFADAVVCAEMAFFVAAAGVWVGFELRRRRSSARLQRLRSLGR